MLLPENVGRYDTFLPGLLDCVITIKVEPSRIAPHSKYRFRPDDTVALAPNEISKVVYRSAPTFSLLVTQYFYKEDTTYNEIIRFR